MTSPDVETDYQSRLKSEFERVRDNLIGEMFEFELSREITEQTTLRLNQLSLDDAMAVHRCAQDLFAARRFEIEDHDSDTDEVVRKFDAILAALVPWLKRNGVIYLSAGRRAS